MKRRHNIFFAAYGASHVKMVIPLVKALSGRCDISTTVLGLTTAGATLEMEGIPYVGFRDIARPVEDAAALETGKRLAVGLTGDAVPIEESIAYLGLSYADLEERLGTDGVKEAYKSKGRQAFMPLGVMERFFRKYEPDLVVTTISPRAEEAAIRTARGMGIPALCMVDHFDHHSIERASPPGYGDRICVLSEGVRGLLLKAGRSPDEVIATGNPALDALASDGLAERGATLRRERGWGAERVVLWASHKEPARHPFTGAQGDPTLPRRIEAALFDIIERRPGWRLVVRPHPNEDVEYGQLPERIEKSGREDALEPLLAAVDCVVIMTSMVGLQARLLGKPVVQVGLSIFMDDAPYRELGIFNTIDGLDELEEALEASLSSEPGVPGGFPVPGRATENVIGVIMDMLNQQEKKGSR